MAPLDPKYWQNRHRHKRLEQPEVYLWRNAKYRAKRKAVDFDIQLEDVVIPLRCPVLGILLTPSEIRLQDSSPTIDRIRPSEGYIKGNVEVISWRANRLKGECTPEDLQKLARYYGKKTRNTIAAENTEKAKSRGRRKVV